MNKPLVQLRQQIDDIDAKILALMERRAVCAKKIAAIKKEQGQPYYCPEREAQILKGVLGHKGQMPAQAMAGVLRELMSVCLSLERRQNIGYLASFGALAYMAARKHFGNAQNLIACDDRQMLEALKRGQLDFVLVPMNHVFDGYCCGLSFLSLGLLSFGLVVVGEVFETATHLAPQSTMPKQSASVEIQASSIARFLVLGHNMPNKSGDDKSFFWLRCVLDIDKAIHVFMHHGVVLIDYKYLVQPFEPWGVGVLLEFDGHDKDVPLVSALTALQAQNTAIVCVGSCPKAPL